jgi:hypothetical protein
MLQGKISEKDITGLKELFAGTPLFKFPVDKNNEIIFKAMTNKVVTQIRTTLLDRQAAGKRFTEWDAEEIIFDQCVVWPEFGIKEKETLPAGIFSSIAKAVRDKSHFAGITETGKMYGTDVYAVKIQDYEYWPDITEEEVTALKASTKFQLHRVRIDRFFFIIRPMTRADLSIAALTADDQLTIVKQVTMWPEQVPWDLIPAGVIEAIGLFANDISGVGKADLEVEEL